MKECRLNDPIRLSVAADARMMLIVRLTTAGAVTCAGLTLDAMDNLKMAVEEACSCLITQEHPPKRLLLTYGCAEGALSVCIRAEERSAGCGCMDEVELDIVRCILESLTDGVTFEQCDGQIVSIELRASLR